MPEYLCATPAASANVTVLAKMLPFVQNAEDGFHQPTSHKRIFATKFKSPLLFLISDGDFI